MPPFLHRRRDEKIGRRAVKKNDEFSGKLSELAKRFAESGLRLTDGSGEVKAVGFVGAVRQQR
jgi:hypothetical protein